MTYLEFFFSFYHKVFVMLDYVFQIVDADEKLNQLIHFLRQHKKEKVMIFFSTCASVDYFARVIQQ